MPNNRFSDDFYERWEHLMSDIEISDVPMRFIREVNIVFDNDNETIFDVVELINNGYAVEDIERTIEEFLEIHDEDISRVDFHLNLIALSEEVGAKTNRLLGDD